MKLKALKLNKLKSAVILNDSEKKAVRGGRADCLLDCGTVTFLLPHYGWLDCVYYGLKLCPEQNSNCSGGCNSW